MPTLRTRAHPPRPQLVCAELREESLNRTVAYLGARPPQKGFFVLEEDACGSGGERGDGDDEEPEGKAGAADDTADGSRRLRETIEDVRRPPTHPPPFTPAPFTPSPFSPCLG